HLLALLGRWLLWFATLIRRRRWSHFTFLFFAFCPFFGWQSELLGRGGGQAWLSSHKRFRLLDRDGAQFVGSGEILKAAQAKVLEEKRGSAVGHRTAHDLGPTKLLHQAALQQGLHDAIDRYAPDLLDLGSGQRLAISNYRQCLQGGLG